MSKHRVLIIAPNWIGDAVMSLPFIKKIKESDCQIDVLATPWVAPVYESCEDVNFLEAYIPSFLSPTPFSPPPFLN